MAAKPRYAVYFAPAAGTALARFGASVIGYDAVAAVAVAHPPPLAAITDWPRLVAEPARYGFHATLKAPFELADGAGAATLVAAVRALAARLPRVVLGHLDVTALSRFVALTPRRAPDGLGALVDTVVADLDHLRAPLAAADRARRLASPLTERQIQHLDRWGYPYVLDEFRLHMTLSGPLPPERLNGIRDVLTGLYVPVSAPVVIDALSIFEQPARDKRFRLLARLPLGAS